MKTILLGILSLIFGLGFYIYMKKTTSLKESAGLSWVANIRGYWAAIGAILLGISMIYREFVK
ncbi:hypothetical protein EGI26_16145 [Lacihabitans sp. CCS-44]|uniref:hypothetical protein n=1 Tax=Lacihabitans sp. CCS-44 TaxID=2487331 RepID=UPI0020CC1CBC|nr:hypothetical protein [Lacihabitans sp. CCS-44]MCP9756698.1 hypothetical protein [Lacihabitans sp. CCS-44]